MPAAIPTTWRRHKATDFTWYNPGSYWAGGTAPAENGGGTAFTVGLNGSLVIASTTQPDYAACAYGIMPLLDARSRQITGDVEFNMGFRLRFASTPLVGDNVIFGVALLNESDITGATVDGGQASLEFTATLTNPRVRVAAINNGTTSGSSNAAAVANIAGMRGEVVRAGVGGSTGSFFGAGDVVGINSSRSYLGGIPATAGAGVAASPGTGALYLMLGFARTLVGDTDALSYDVIFETQPVFAVTA